MTRVELIRTHLATSLLRDHGVAVVTPDESAWTAPSCDGHFAFGWSRPMPLEDDSAILLVGFCPEVIAKSTAHLDQEHLEVYLATIEAFLSAYIEDPLADHDGVRHSVEDRLYDEYPDALSLMSEVEARFIGTRA